MDNLAAQLKEEILIQKGSSVYTPHHADYFAYTASIDQHIERSRLIVSHGGFTGVELLLKKKNMIIVPRQPRYGEHGDKHQIELCEFLHQKYGIKVIYDIEDLTVDLLKKHQHIPQVNNTQLQNLKSFIRNYIHSGNSG